MQERKKKILIHSNFCNAFTGFGKNKKNILRHLFNTGKYNIIELANGVHWQDPSTENVPWTCRGALPPQNELQNLNAEQQRSEGYGNKLVDKAIEEKAMENAKKRKTEEEKSGSKEETTKTEK